MDLFVFLLYTFEQVGEITTIPRSIEGNKVVPIELETMRPTEGKLPIEIDRDSSTEVSKEYGMSNEQQLLDQCYTTPKPVPLKSVTFPSLENSQLAAKHIIVCGMVSSLTYLVIPLRAKILKDLQPIVILHTEEPTDGQWNSISMFPQIYFVKGSALNLADLSRANIKQAKKVVILSTIMTKPDEDKFKDELEEELEDKPGEGEKLSRSMEDLLDAKCIFMYKNIKKVRKDIEVVTEIVSPDNIAFLQSCPKDYANMKKYGFDISPTYAGGEVLLSSVMDRLLCQSYFNPAYLTVLNLLLIGKAQLKTANEHTAMSSLYQIPIPPMQDNRFSTLFETLAMARRIIPLALYRKHTDSDKRQFSYVCTNPPQDTILRKDDQVIVLASEGGDHPYEMFDFPERTASIKKDLGDDMIPLIKIKELNEHKANQEKIEEIEKLYNRIEKNIEELKTLNERMVNLRHDIASTVKESVATELKQLHGATKSQFAILNQCVIYVLAIFSVIVLMDQ
eukprot:TRINITY_DN88679_c0_g1_i1.p2 TRINITY_DN88679_c0_g1~~TRINITY_DN88679_c0_g1_i1.p2  ORF type:complete len:507 (-),score=57.99 TRINITY_DN88679_c0_g1_i1:17-1537(-)